MRHDRAPADDADDGVLIAASARGDVRAYGVLVGRHQDAARRLAASLVGPHEADDVAQDAFVRAYRSLARFRTGAAFRPWLLTIVANQAADRRRADDRRSRREAIADRRATRTSPGADDLAEREEERRRVTTALASLTEKDRNVLVFRYILDCSEAEAAVALGVARGTVKSKTSRALSKLRTRLESEHPEAGSGHA